MEEWTGGDNTKYAYYLRDLGYDLREQAEEALREARHLRNAPSLADPRTWADAELATYARILSLMQHQADSFEIPYRDLALDGLDPDNDFVIHSDMPTPRKRSRWPKTFRIGRLYIWVLAAWLTGGRRGGLEPERRS